VFRFLGDDSIPILSNQEFLMFAYNRQMVWMGVGLVATVLTAGTASAEVSQDALDEQISEALKQVINEGAKLYNDGFPTECVYFFRGGLTAVQPLLRHKPRVQKAITNGLAAAGRQGNMREQAWMLHRLLNTARNEVSPEMPETGVGKTLWERLGGEKNVTRIVNDFVETCLADPNVNFDRGGKYKMTPERVVAVKQHMVRLASAIGGGPYKYDGRSMKKSHEGMNITNDEFDASVSHLKIALLRHGVKPPEIVTVMDAVALTRRDFVRPPDKVQAPINGATLWERLGGEKGVTQLIDDLVDAALEDPKVNFDRGGKYKMTPDKIKELKRQLVSLASSLGGGPETLKYTGRRMLPVHKGMGITNDEFDAFLTHLKIALVKNKASEKDRDFILKAVNGTRKDIVEVKSGEAPLPGVGAGAGRNPPRTGIRDARQPSRPRGTRTNVDMSALLESLQWAIVMVGAFSECMRSALIW
jgi:truncated hemoglobin YjbI